MPTRLTTEEFVAKATNIHGGKYDYSHITYTNGRTLLKLFCKEHRHYFETTAENHTHNKGGCDLCRYEKSAKSMAWSTERFVEKAIRIYDGKFDYSQVNYKDAKTKVLIRCKEHDFSFWQTPDKHLSCNGCGACVKNGYNKSKQGSIYILTHENLTKIGITNREVSLRSSAISKSSGLCFSTDLYIKFSNGAIPVNVETKVLQSLRRSHKQPESSFDGSTECFLDVDYDLLVRAIVVGIQTEFLK